MTFWAWFEIFYSGLQINVLNLNYFWYFSTKANVVGTQKNRLNETVLLSTQNMFSLLGKKIFAFLRSKFLYNWTYGLLSHFFFRRYKMCHIQSFLLLYIATCVSADLYLHSIRGSNNRLNEKTAKRKTNDRLFDSQVGTSGLYVNFLTH